MDTLVDFSHSHMRTVPDTTGWKDRHYHGLLGPRPEEEVFVRLADAITFAARFFDGTYTVDYVSGAALGRMLDSFLDLLNYDTGRLDQTVLCRWAEHTAHWIGYDLDKAEWVGLDDEPRETL